MPPPEVNPFLQNTQILGGTAELLKVVGDTEDSIDRKIIMTT
jgi:hypothetical protein